MTTVLGFLSDRAWHDLVVALLHTLWQGAVVSLLLAAALRRIPASRPEARYLLAVSSQFAVLALGLGTWSILGYEPSPRIADAPPIEARSIPEGAIPFTAAGDPPSPAPVADPSVPWTSFLAAAWLAGVAAMLARTSASVWSASRMARGPIVRDEAIRGLVDRIRSDLGIRRSVRVVEADDGFGPSVMGVVWPTLLIPASAMTGLPTETLHALLIHELSHIRRHDYLVNLGQLAVESLLFFNPMVWWLGRQARLEREACCDASAVRLTGRPLDYSRSLAEWAGRVSGASVVAAIGGDGRAGMLLERIRRILKPGDRPSVRVSMSGLVLLLVGGPIVLVMLWRGTDAAVRAAAQALSPAERVEQVRRAQAQYSPMPATAEGRGTIKGTIRTPDDQPLAKSIRFYSSTRRPDGGGYGQTLGEFRDAFSVEVPSGITWLMLNPEGHAPAFAGPIEVRPRQTVEGIAIRLEVGFPAKVRVTDAQGHPIPDARVSAFPNLEGVGWVGGAIGWTTDRDGVATIPHALAREYSFSAEAHGFQPMKDVQAAPAPGEVVALRLNRALPVRGLAVGPDGKPVAGAEVRVFNERSDHGSFWHGLNGPLIATTGPDGRFLLDTLRTGATYDLFLAETSKTGMRGMITDVVPGQANEVRATLEPKRTLRGTIVSGKVPRPGSVIVSQKVPGPRAYRLEAGTTADAQGRFQVGDLFPGPAQVQAQAGNRTFDVELKDKLTTVTLDLSGVATPKGPPRRRVVLVVKTPDRSTPPLGRIHVQTAPKGDLMATDHHAIAIENGRATLDAPAPGTVMYDLIAMPGYWFPDRYDVEVRPGEGEQIVEIAAMPAGALVGRVLGPDGRPSLGDVYLSCRTIEPPPARKDPQFPRFHRDNIPADAEGRFFVSPVPIGGVYAVSASQGHNVQVSPPIRLDDAHPTRKTELKLAPTATAAGRVLNADGRPIPGMPVTLRLDHPIVGTTWSPPVRSGDDGGFRFDGLSREMEGYQAFVNTGVGYQPAEAPLHPGGPPTEIRLERGHVIEGRILDARTGWPIPGVEVYALRERFVQGQRYGFEAEAKTDDQGRFRFSDLPEGRWQLGDRNGLQRISPRHDHVFDVDTGVPIEIRATLPTWSGLKPRPPASTSAPG